MSRPQTDDGHVTPPKKKVARHVSSKWQAEWAKFGMASSKKGSSYAFCTVCNCDISVAGGGVHEVKRHCSSKKHTDNQKATSQTPTLTTALFAGRSEPVSVTRLQVRRSCSRRSSLSITCPSSLLITFPNYAKRCSLTARSPRNILAAGLRRPP